MILTTMLMKLLSNLILLLYNVNNFHLVITGSISMGSNGSNIYYAAKPKATAQCGGGSSGERYLNCGSPFT